MTIAYGNTVQHWRCKIDAFVAAQTTTQTTITVRTYWQSISWGYAVNGCTGYAQCGSYSSGTKTFTASSSTGQTKEIKVAEVSHTYTRGSSNQKVTCKAQVKQVDYHAGTSTVSVNLTVPKIDYSAPNAPSGISATRNSDSKITVKWTNGATSTTKPRSNVLVERSWGPGAETYGQVAKLSSSATSYTDTSVAAARRYRYRVRSYGAGGYSSYSATSWVYMTPAAPSAVSISRYGDGTGVQVNATVSNVNYATSYNVQYALDGGSWTSAGSATSFPFTFTPTTGGSTQVRVQSVRGSLASAWKTSNSITTLVPPLQPVVTLTPAGTYHAVESELTISWAATYPAGDSQTKAQVTFGFTPDGGTYSSQVKEFTTETSWVLPAESLTEPGTGVILVQVWGEDEQSSPVSRPVMFYLKNPPQVNITSPAVDGEEVRELPLVAAWEVISDTSLQSQKLCILDEEENHLASWDLDPSTREYTLGLSQFQFTNQTHYVLEINAADGWGITTRELREFTTNWLPPAAPSGEAEPDGETFTMEVTPFFGEDAEAPETVSLAVSRYIPTTGETWLIADGLEDGQTVIDPLPPLNLDYYYVITAVAATGATNETRLPAYFAAKALVFNWGQNASEVYGARYNPSFSGDINRDFETFKFADGGTNSGLPVAYEGENLVESIKASFTILGIQDALKLLALAKQHASCWFRDYYGNRYTAAATWSFSEDSKNVFGVDATLTVTGYEEAW